MTPARARELTLPLQVGTSALWSGARSAATFLPAIGLVASGVYLVIDTGSIEVLFFFVVVGGAFLYYAAKHFTLALRLRPSDVVLNADGVRIIGGRERNELIRWSEIATERCRVEETVEDRVTFVYLLIFAVSAALSIVAQSAVDLTPERKLTIWKLWLSRRAADEKEPAPAQKLSRRAKRRLKAQAKLAAPDAGALLIAETERPSEQESFQALVDSIHAAGEQGDDGDDAREQKGISGVLHCTSCGAPLPPTEEPVATCARCGGRVDVPPALQEQLRAARTHAQDDAAIHRRVRRLLDQPGATYVNVMMAVAALPMFIAWPAAVYVAIRQYLEDSIAFSVTAPLFVFPLATILGCFLLVRVRLANRAALRILALDFGARAPLREGNPRTCRECGAPLRDLPGEVVERCGYCSAENLLGLDLRRRAARSAAAAKSLRDTLGARSRERWKFGLMAIVAVGVLVLGAELLARGLRIAPGPRGRCRHGDARSCMALGKAATEEAGRDTAKLEKAAKWYALACDAGDADGCAARGKAAQDYGPPDSWGGPAKARPWYVRACDHGSKDGCVALGSIERDDHHRDLAATAYARGCALGDRHGCIMAAYLYDDAHDLARAKEQYRRACQLGDKSACTHP